MRARRLRTLAARSGLQSSLTPLTPSPEKTPRKQTNVSGESRLVREATPSDKEVVSLPTPKAPPVTVWPELGGKPDMDVEMKSVASTPVQDVEMTPALSLPAANEGTKRSVLQSSKISPGNPEVAMEPAVGSPPKSVDEQNEQLLSRLLNATWNEFGSGSIICAQSASFLEQQPSRRFDFECIVSNVLMEAALKIYNDELSEGEGGSALADDKEFSSAKKIKSDDTEVQEILANAVATSLQPVPNEADAAAGGAAGPMEATSSEAGGACATPSVLSIVTTTKHHVLLYLIRCYQNYQAECARKTPYNQPALQLAFEHVMRMTVLVLTDRIHQNLNAHMDQSALLELMYMDKVNESFLIDLVAHTHPDGDSFDAIFGQVLRGLFAGMQRNICTSKINVQQIEWLAKLVVIKVGPVRPIADLVARQPNFLPPICTKISGREIVKCSFLGPFLSVSLFAEENVKFAEFSTKNKLEDAASSRLRWELHSMRTHMHTVFHSLCVNASSRPKTMEYIAKILRHNDRRVQFASDEKLLARDGFVINLMSVLQQLAVKIKLDRIEPNFHYHKNSLVNIEQDTKIRYSEEEYRNFLARDFSEPVENANFQTQCWFLTLQAHHLGYLPAIQRYRQKVRAIKELQKLIDELDRTKPHWVNSRYASRNNQFKERWEKQLRKLNRWVFLN